MIYEYQCRKCQAIFDMQMSLAQHEKREARCPRCQSADIDQRMTGFSARTSRKAA